MIRFQRIKNNKLLSKTKKGEPVSSSAMIIEQLVISVYIKPWQKYDSLTIGQTCKGMSDSTLEVVRFAPRGRRLLCQIKPRYK